MLCSVVIASILLLPQLVNAVTVDAKLDGARKEGSLIVYTAMQPEDSTKLVELYRSRYPFVDATFFRAGSAPLLNRIFTEPVPVVLASTSSQERFQISSCCRREDCWEK